MFLNFLFPNLEQCTIKYDTWDNLYITIPESYLHFGLTWKNHTKKKIPRIDV